MGNRREFLKVSLAASAGIAICGCSGNGSTAKIFDDSERNCLIAISEQIVPADEQWGGATEAGVINYIENWVGKYYPEMLPTYKKGISAVQNASQRLYSKNFQELEFDVQTDFLKKWNRERSTNRIGRKLTSANFLKRCACEPCKGFTGRRATAEIKTICRIKCAGWKCRMYSVKTDIKRAFKWRLNTIKSMRL